MQKVNCLFVTGCNFPLPTTAGATEKTTEDDLEPKGKAWSTKNLSEYVRKVGEMFTDARNFVRDIYNVFYGELPQLPEKPDGLDMFRGCELLQMSEVQPGGEENTEILKIIAMFFSSRWFSLFLRYRISDDKERR